MKNAEYQGNLSCPQRDGAEHEGYAGAQSVGGQDAKEQDGADLLERILSRENLNRAYKRVKANKGAPGIDGMTVEQALPWLRVYLNEYDKEMERRGVPVIRYADDIVVLSRSKRAAERLLESNQRYLEGKLKLKMNVEKSRVVSVFSIRNFKFLGFALGKGRKGVYV